MRVTAVCDSSHQLLTTWGLSALGALDASIDLLISIGGESLRARARDVATELGAAHHHLLFPATFDAQLRAARSVLGTASADIIVRLSRTERLIVFNDGHPGVAAVRRACSAAGVALIEEGTGAHRTRPTRRLTKFVARLLTPGINMSGRQGEATWIDELWVSQTDTLTERQRSKRVRVFDRAALVRAMRDRWGVSAALPPRPQPILIFLGQPFVEDGVLTMSEYQQMLATVRAAVPAETNGRLLRAYKPHPREREPRPSAAMALGEDASVLERDVPIEILHCGHRPVLLVALTSGGLRGMPSSWSCVSVAPCFRRLKPELGSSVVFPNVVFVNQPDGLTAEIREFVHRFRSLDRATG